MKEKKNNNIQEQEIQEQKHNAEGAAKQVGGVKKKEKDRGEKRSEKRRREGKKI